MLLLTRFQQNCQAAFGRCEHLWVKEHLEKIFCTFSKIFPLYLTLVYEVMLSSEVLIFNPFMPGDLLDIGQQNCKYL